jgi:hypothetical protein
MDAAEAVLTDDATEADRLALMSGREPRALAALASALGRGEPAAEDQESPPEPAEGPEEVADVIELAGWVAATNAAMGGRGEE